MKLGRIISDLADVLPGRCRGVDGYTAIVVLDNVFHHYDRVAIIRDRVAGIHGDELIILQLDGRGLGSAEAIPGPQGNAIHCAGRVMGRINPSINSVRCDAPVGILHRNCFQLHAEALILQFTEVFLLCLLQRHIR